MTAGNESLACILGPWPGPYGGVPPVDKMSPELIEQGVRSAIEQKQAAVREISANPDAPSFANTVEALEESGRALRNAEAVLSLFATTGAIGETAELRQRLAPAIAKLEDEIALDDALFARIDAVHERTTALEPLQARLTQVVRDRLKRQGAGLPQDLRARLIEVNRLIADKQAQFHRNELGEGERLLWIEDESELDGLPGETVAAAADFAKQRDREGQWALANRRPVYLATMQHARSRDLRKRVRDMWVRRNANGDDFDNRTLVREIVALRGEKAKLLGHRSYAHLAVSNKMAETPERAREQLLAVWRPARRDAVRRLGELQQLADADGLGGPIEAHDYLFYAERFRQKRFQFNGNEVRDHLQLENVLSAIFDAAGRLFDLSFKQVESVPTIHSDVRVYEVLRGNTPIAVIYLDLIARPGKMPGAWQQELRQWDGLERAALPLSVISAGIEAGAAGSPVLMNWELANVLFHEFGHALHMILSRAPYPSLGSVNVEWDFVELPSQLNERWLYDPDLLRRHARHHASGAPLCDAAIEALIAVRNDERVVSVTLPYLAPAIVDLEVYLAAEGGEIDPFAIESRVYAELDVPAAIDPVFRLPSQHHSFTDVYAGALYSYLWADVMVAEVLEAFAEAGDLYDAATARRWHDEVLSVGSALPAAQAFRNFRGRDPDPAALMRRFDLQEG